MISRQSAALKMFCGGGANAHCQAMLISQFSCNMHPKVSNTRGILTKTHCYVLWVKNVTQRSVFDVLRELFTGLKFGLVPLLRSIFDAGALPWLFLTFHGYFQNQSSGVSLRITNYPNLFAKLFRLNQGSKIY